MRCVGSRDDIVKAGRFTSSVSGSVSKQRCRISLSGPLRSCSEIPRDLISAEGSLEAPVVSSFGSTAGHSRGLMRTSRVQSVLGSTLEALGFHPVGKESGIVGARQ